MKSKKETKKVVSKKKASTNEKPHKEKKAAAKKAADKKPAAKKPNKPIKDVKDYVSDRVFDGKRPLSKARTDLLKAKNAKKNSSATSKKENVKLPKKIETATKPKKEKKFFPKGAKPPAAPTGAIEPKVASKRTPWMKKPIENPHSTPAGPCVNLKDLFDNYLDKRYKKLKEEQRRVLWQAVSLQMLSEPFSKLNEIIDSHLSKK